MVDLQRHLLVVVGFGGNNGYRYIVNNKDYRVDFIIVEKINKSLLYLSFLIAVMYLFSGACF